MTALATPPISGTPDRADPESRSAMGPGFGLTPAPEMGTFLLDPPPSSWGRAAEPRIQTFWALAPWTLVFAAQNQGDGRSLSAFPLRRGSAITFSRGGL